MKASTARALKTLLFLVIVGGGAYWAYGNVLPLVKGWLSGLKPGTTPSGGSSQGGTPGASGAASGNYDVNHDGRVSSLYGVSDVGLIAALMDGPGKDAFAAIDWPYSEAPVVTSTPEGFFVPKAQEGVPYNLSQAVRMFTPYQGSEAGGGAVMFGDVGLVP